MLLDFGGGGAAAAPGAGAGALKPVSTLECAAPAGALAWL